MNHRYLSAHRVLPVLVAIMWLGLAPSADQSAAPAAKPAAPSQAKTWSVPKTSWGHPDLQAIWNNDAENAIPLEVQAERPRAPRPEGAGPGLGGPSHWGEGARGAEDPASARKSLIVDPPDGKLPPLTPEAQKRADAKAAEQRGAGLAGAMARLHAWDHCITRGVPDSMLPRLYSNNYQIVQTPEYVAIFHEMIHDTRIIPLDGRPHLPDNIRLWMGDSRGRWEGNTLVVETKNFNGKTENNLIPHQGAGSYRGPTDSLHLVERFTRISADTIDYRFTVNDPKLYTRPWTAALTLTTRNSPDVIFEYACHEGNYAVPNTITGALVEEAAAAKEKGR